LFWLFQECDLNDIQLGGMVSPHPPLAINKPSQDQQAKQDCVHLPEDLWKEGEGRGGGKRLRGECKEREEGIQCSTLYISDAQITLSTTHYIYQSRGITCIHVNTLTVPLI